MKMSINSLRESLKNQISDSAKFLSEGIGVPIIDEKNIKLFHIIKENIIYIEDTNQNNISNVNKEVPKMKEKIPIILKFDEDVSSIIKANSDEKLDKIREQNGRLIINEFLFTLQGSNITNYQESKFTIGKIIYNSNYGKIQK